MSKTYTPTRRKIFNQLDEWGIMLDTPRLDNEDNYSYKDRLLDVMAHRANSTYMGLIYAITRELGLERYKAMDITYAGTGTRPVVKVEDRYLYLYSEYPTTLDAKINIWQEESILSSERLVYMYELRDKINSYSDWSVSLLTDEWNFSSNIYNQSNLVTVEDEAVPEAPKFPLTNSGILDYTVGQDATIWFSDTDAFNPAQKKTSESAVTQHGDWYIDVDNGIVTTYTASACTVRYQYIENPYTLMASPVEIYDIASSGIWSIMFETETLDDGTESLVGFTDIGFDIFLELLSASKDTTWGDD